jgi:acyl-CoA thioester hydrolase
MTGTSDSTFPTQHDVPLRQADLGRDGSASTIGVARWLEDARVRVRLPRFERRVRAGQFDPFRILLVSQRVERLAPVGWADGRVQVHTGFGRIGRSSFTFQQAVFVGGTQVASGDATVVLGGTSGSLALPDELIEDLNDLRLPESDQKAGTTPDAERHQRDHYSFFAPLSARIGDVDSNQHVNFIALATWYDEAVAALSLTEVAVDEGGLGPNLPPWSYRIRYLGEVAYPGDYDIGVRVETVEDNSLRYALGIFRGAECLGVADAVGARGELSADRSSGSANWRGKTPSA